MKRIIPRFQWPSRWSQQLQKLPIAFFLICTLVFFAFGNSSKPRVLVLDSYATDFAWTKDINVGLNWVLEKKTLFDPVSLYGYQAKSWASL